MTSPETDIIALMAGAGLVALLAAYLVARRLMAAGYSWADALVVEAVAIIGGIGAVQSYTALRWLALLGDLPEWLADVAPATVDLFAVVMGLAALRARRASARDRYADRLALGYSVAAVLANLAAAGLDVSQHPGYTAARAVVVLLAHAAPVVTFLLGSHWLMGRQVGAGADIALVTEPQAAPVEAGAEPDHGNGAEREPASEPERIPSRARVPARAQVRAMLRRDPALTAERVMERTGLGRKRAVALLREERQPHLVPTAQES